MRFFGVSACFLMIFLPVFSAQAKPRSGSLTEENRALPLKTPKVADSRSHKKKKLAKAPTKTPQTITNDKGRVLRKLSSEDIKTRINDRLQSLFRLCRVQGKNTKQKTVMFIEELKKIRDYTVDEEEYTFRLKIEDRLTLHSIRSQIDTALSDIKDFQKKRA